MLRRVEDSMRNLNSRRIGWSGFGLAWTWEIVFESQVWWILWFGESHWPALLFADFC